MDIQHKDNGQKGLFYAVVDGKTEAEMTYVWSGDHRIIIDHTGVSEAIKGQGVGNQLVQAAVVFACEKQLKIMPLFPFARAVFDKMPDYQDVLF